MRVGVVVPAFDAAPWIAACVGSVIAQSHPDWAIVVVDDGSTDGTAARIPREPRVTAIEQANAGVSAARNRGAAALPAVDAVLFLDADDRLAPDALARLTAALATAPRGVVACVGGWQAVREDGAPLGPPRPAMSLAPDPVRSVLRRNPFVNGGHVLIRAGAVAALGGFRRDLRFGEDWEYWVRLALLGGFARLSGPAPVLFARARECGAYRQLVQDPGSVAACLDALFAAPGLGARLRDAPRVRARTANEMDWTVGRELFRSGRTADARALLRRSVRGAPSLRRMAVTALAHAPALWPVGRRGPFAPPSGTAPRPVTSS